jgi:phage protein D
MANDLLKTARPSIFVDGREDARLAGGLLRMCVGETIEGLYRAELRFGNWGSKNDQVDYLYFDRKTLDFGKSLRLSLDGDVLFDGRISAIEAEYGEGSGPEVAVLLEDRLEDLRMTRRTRIFNDVTDAQVIQRVANDHGLQPQIDVDGPTHKVIAQVNQSDLAFIRERARAAGAELWIDDRKLYAKARTARTGTAIKLRYGAELRQFTATADLAHQRSSVTVSGWDVAGKRAIKHKADEAAVRNELGDDSGGAKILGDAFGDRAESVAHTIPFSADEAKARAEAWYRAAARRFVVGRGFAQPNAKLRVGVWVELDGLGPLFNGKYYLAGVQHLFDGASGFRSEFTAERPGLGKAN